MSDVGVEPGHGLRVISGAEPVKKVSLVIPVFNEAENVPLLYRQIVDCSEAWSFDWELVMVDDGSRDATFDSLSRLAAEDPRLKVLSLRRNSGQTAALMAGIDHATGDFIVPMDGDLQNDPADIGKLLDKLEEGYDVVSGWRRNRQDNFLHRTLPSRLANRLISWVTGVHLHDYGCALKAYRAEVLRDVRLYGEMHRFLPVYVSWSGARVTETEVRHHPRTHGHSKYGLERTLKVLLDLMVVRFLDRYQTKPIYVFGGFGAMSLAASGATFAYMLGLKLLAGKSFIATPLPLVVVMTFLCGAMSILMGLLAELMTRTYFESQERTIYAVKQTLNLDRGFGPDQQSQVAGVPRARPRRRVVGE
jgi:glycosyltransferase involved in cell wall biosynthesis